MSWIDVPLLGHRVYDCPCNWHLNLYRFLEHHKEGIIRFYKERAEFHQKKLDENRKALEEISQDV